MNVYPLKCRIRNADGDVTRVDVYDDIGPGGWFSDGLTAKDFAATMGGVKGALEVHINSGGGDVFDGIAIGNAIRAHKGPVTTVVDGIAASIASVIAQAGEQRVMQPGSMLMIHDAFGMCIGNAAEMAKFAETLSAVSDNLAEIYASSSGKTAGHWRDAMRAETWYTAEEATAAGLADRVGDGTAELPSGLDLAAFAAPRRIAAALRRMPRADTADGDGPGPAGHGPFSGDHSHTHPAYGTQGDDETHGHTHSHDGDADHDHHDGTSAHAHGLTVAQVAEVVRNELHAAGIIAADVDEGTWDGPAAMSRASKADNPAAAFRAICAGERSDGDPDEEAHWALPHHANAGDPPNRKGVTSALGYLDRTQGLTNKSAAQAHLEAHQRAMGDGNTDDQAGIAWLHDLMGGES